MMMNRMCSVTLKAAMNTNAALCVWNPPQSLLLLLCTGKTVAASLPFISAPLCYMHTYTERGRPSTRACAVCVFLYEFCDFCGSLSAPGAIIGMPPCVCQEEGLLCWRHFCSRNGHPSGEGGVCLTEARTASEWRRHPNRCCSFMSLLYSTKANSSNSGHNGGGRPYAARSHTHTHTREREREEHQLLTLGVPLLQGPQIDFWSGFHVRRQNPGCCGRSFVAHSQCNWISIFQYAEDSPELPGPGPPSLLARWTMFAYLLATVAARC